MDRDFAEPLDVASVAAVAHMSSAHFIREFARVFGETPHRYLQRRRVERAMFLLRTTDAPVTEICHAVGFTSIGTFGRTFTDIVGRSPSAYRAAADGVVEPNSGAFVMRWGRPSTFDDAVRASAVASNFGEAGGAADS